MRINIETSGGGGVVLVVAAVLLSGHGGDVSGALTAVVITVAVVAVLAVAALVAFLVWRARRQDRQEYAPYAVRQIRADVVPPPVQAPERAALEAPPVRLDPAQLAELAEILRRQQAAE